MRSFPPNTGLEVPLQALHNLCYISNTIPVTNLLHLTDESAFGKRSRGLPRGFSLIDKALRRSAGSLKSQHNSMLSMEVKARYATMI